MTKATISRRGSSRPTTRRIRCERDRWRLPRYAPISIAHGDLGAPRSTSCTTTSEVAAERLVADAQAAADSGCGQLAVADQAAHALGRDVEALRAWLRERPGEPGAALASAEQLDRSRRQARTLRPQVRRSAGPQVRRSAGPQVRRRVGRVALPEGGSSA
jgi:hypothetical protein